MNTDVRRAVRTATQHPADEAGGEARTVEARSDLRRELAADVPDVLPVDVDAIAFRSYWFPTSRISSTGTGIR